MRAGLVCEQVFRHAGGCLIATPDLYSPPSLPGVMFSGATFRWVATVWRDEFRHDGWGALVRSEGERGWELPRTLAIGDIIEFGLVRYDVYGRPVEQQTVRWW